MATTKMPSARKRSPKPAEAARRPAKNSACFSGQPIPRVEDHRLLTGHGQFVDDIRLPDTAHMAMLRSPYAHARIIRVDTTRARALPGVIEILTGPDVKDALGQIPVLMRMPNFNYPPHYFLAVDRVRYQGEPVAAVVAEDAYTARDAVELIDVEYEPLPVVIDAEKALEKNSPILHEGFSNNVGGTYSVVSGDVLEAFRNADRVVKARIINQRLAPSSMECRAVLASFQPGDGNLTIWTSTQIPHLLRNFLATTLKVPDHRLRLIAPDVGGAFGSKLNVYPEDALAPHLAMKLGRPVKWAETRRENIRATTHGRSQVQKIDLAFSKDGHIRGMRCRSIFDAGAYFHMFTAVGPTSTANLGSGCYKIPAYSFGVTEVFTNKMSTDAYRGAGRPEAIYLIERAMDIAASELGLDPVALRLKNLITPKDLPYTTPAGRVYDSGNYPRDLRGVLKFANYEKLRRQQAAWLKNDRLMGIGVVSYVENCGPGPTSAKPPGGGWETATVRVEPSGRVTVLTGTSPHGQGEETTFAQLVGDEFGVPFAHVAVMHGDTQLIAAGVGTFGSRNTSVGGSAVVQSCRKLKEKITTIAAHLLETQPERITWREGILAVKGSPKKSLPLADVAQAAYRARNLPKNVEPGLEAVSFYNPRSLSFPSGAHVCVVEVDRDTGEVQPLEYYAIDDCGRVINPLLVEGQIEGGIAQGLGQALYEELVFDENGQVLTGEFMDYTLPHAAHTPRYHCTRSETPTQANLLGVKGVGESGTIGATPCVVNAVIDALKPFGVKHLDMPLKPEKIWRAIHNAEGSGS
jgi:carbon-monoxide dehydrogenase large subunit